MKSWFTKRGAKSPYDATVEQTLRFAQEVDETSADASNEGFLDLASALTPPAKRVPAPSIPLPVPSSVDVPAPPAAAKPMVSRGLREELERRKASYRAHQLKLNEDREIRIRNTMAEVRAQLQRSAMLDQFKQS